MSGKDAGGDGVDAGSDGEGDDAAPPEPDAATAGPAIRTVETSDGYTQIRQGRTIADNSEVELVVTGVRLDGVTSVMLGELAAYQVEAKSEELRAWLQIPHATEPGPRHVTVSGPGGFDIMANAIEVTPYVVASSAPPGGHGTFQSPLLLCDDQIEATQSGDTVFLLAGAHSCETGVDLLQGGQIIQGKAAATTIVGSESTGFGGFRIHGPSDSEAVTAFRDLTIKGSGGEGIQIFQRGALTVERVAMIGSRISLGDCTGCKVRTTVSASTFNGAGIHASGHATFDVSDSAFIGSARGIRSNGGQFSITRTVFHRCFTAVAMDKGDTEAVRGEIHQSVFSDNQTGLILRTGRLAITDTPISQTGTSVGPNRRGIYINGGELAATRVTITGHAVSGIEAFVSAAEADRARVVLDEVLIEGGQYGVYLHGASEGGGLVMRSSVVRDQTIAAVSFGFPRAIASDLSGNNHLSVKSGVALEDARIDPQFGGPIEAAGITLNGNSYTGVVQGPTEFLPDYRILDDGGAIQF